jgi:peptide/nickel transport system permease protein
MRYFVERTGQAVVTIFAVITGAFVLTRLMPGGPMDYIRAQLAQQNMPTDQVNIEVEQLTGIDPDAPMWVQYVDYMSGLVQGDLGQSIYYDRAVGAIITEALPWTAFVMILALVISFGLAVVLGAFFAYYEGSRVDTAGSLVATLFNSVPYYVAAIIFLLVFSYQLELFPTGGNVSSDVEAGLTLTFLVDATWHAAMPVASFVVTTFGLQALAMRGNSIRVLGEDYLRVARLRGLPDRRIGIHYVARNAILPLYTEFMIAIGFMFGGSIILEQIFSYPGIGFYLFQSISSRDFPLMMGTFIVITVSVTVAVYIADLTYGFIDPRAGGNNESY